MGRAVLVFLVISYVLFEAAIYLAVKIELDRARNTEYPNKERISNG